MTTIEASIKLFDWFSESDYFNYPKDCQKLLNIYENDYDVLPIKAALANLQESKIVTSETDKAGNFIYFLNRKLHENDQSLELNYSVAFEIAHTINVFCEETLKDTSDICNPCEIKQKDILNLLHIINFYKKSLDKQEEIQ